MEKPKPVPVTKVTVKFSAARDWVEEKYQFKSRDYAGMFADGHNPKKPYLDYWHWMVDIFDIHNGTDIEFSNETLEMAQYSDEHETGEIAECLEKYPEFKGWRAKITEYILSEFGQGENREVSFNVSW